MAFILSQSPALPAHCEPTSDFLLSLSQTFHTCIPTPLALISTTLGVLSILSWLFAQLPQIYKNYKVGSTSGLSIYFLVEWCLGDLSNLAGAILTNQASWQICIGGYYVFVDLCLVCQWIWYEKLKHGNIVRRVWQRRTDSPGNESDGWRDGDSGKDRMSSSGESNSGSATLTYQSEEDSIDDDDKTGPRPIFRSPNFATQESTGEKQQSPQASPISRTIHRDSTAASPSIFSPSPRTLLLVIALSALANASPLHQSPPLQSTTTTTTTTNITNIKAILGPIFSWTSTTLYLLSRLPQLLQNYRRKSTAGLSPLLFAAAFSGNLFYSTALLTNPCAWESFSPYGGRGWVGREGSVRDEWITSAMPFFLGAAGVLVMDACVGWQFAVYGAGDQRVVVGVEGSEGASSGGSVSGDVAGGDDRRDHRYKTQQRKWRRVSGWMRGWIPGSTGGRSESVGAGEQAPLLTGTNANERADYRGV